MSRLEKAIAAAREALAMTGDYADPPGYALRDLIAALDAARYAAPPAAACDCDWPLLPARCGGACR